MILAETNVAWCFIKSKSMGSFTLKAKKHLNETQNEYSSWQYTEVIWSGMIGLCKKLNIITCNPQPQANDCDAYAFCCMMMFVW